jgi:hypothetical protein
MLQEMTATRQILGEKRRRWFFSAEQDLVVWFDEEENIAGFQLAYNKHLQERSIYWKAGKGFSHYDVDDGEGSPFSSQTPLLTLDGAFDRDTVLQAFLGLAQELPSEILSFVENKLREYTATTPFRAKGT